MAKGQGGFEYLSTYGWAILVIMVIGVVLWSLGIFEAQGSQTTTGFKSMKPLLAGTTLTYNGGFTGVFSNSAGATVAITSVILENTNDGRNCSLTTLFPVVVAKGGAFKIEASNCNRMTHIGGESYSLLVRVYYNLSIGSVQAERSDSGTINSIYT